MDKLFSTCGFDFADMEELIAELPTDHDLWEAPGFDRVLFHADASGMAVTAMEYEGEWAAVPSYRGGEEAPGTIYRATPYIGIVETGIYGSRRWRMRPSRCRQATQWAEKSSRDRCGRRLWH